MSETVAANQNPLLASDGLPRFQDIRPEQVLPAVEQVVAKIEQDLADLEANHTPTWAGLIEPYMQLGDELDYAWSPVSHLLSVRNTDELRDVYEQAQPLVVQLSLQIGQSKAIYEGLCAVRDGDEWAGFNRAQQRTVEKYIQAAERSGVGLEDDAKATFLGIQRELSELSVKFNNNVLDATKAFGLNITDQASTQGWPKTLKAVASQAYNAAKGEDEAAGTASDGPWRITLDYPSFGPFMQHHRVREQREAVLRAFSGRASSGEHDNTQTVERILDLQRQAANLLGHETYVHMSLSEKMASTPANVWDMYAKLEEAAKPASVKEIQALKAFAKDNGFEGELKPWDVSFWTERQREALFEFTDEQLRPYFPMPRVLSGLFDLCTKLFDVTFVCIENEPTVWHEDVRFYHVLDASGTPIAGFYLDPYARPADKRGGAWMNDCLARRIEADGSLRLPIAHLVCNGTPPTEGTPSLMSFGEVETLFHEFGHGLQHMLTQQPYTSVAGIHNVEWDAVELPSQFMENWCYHKPILMGMTQHIETGESLPDDLYQKLVKAKTHMAGNFIMRQMTLGQTDMTLYETYTPGQASEGKPNAHEIATAIATKLMPLPPLPEARSLCSFGHIFGGGYAAGYFSYLWAEVLSADAYAAFVEAGLDNDEAVESLGRKFRDTVLGQGGGEHPMVVYEAFRGRQPDPEALLRDQGLI